MTYPELLRWSREQLNALYSNQEVQHLVRIWMDEQSQGWYTFLLSDPKYVITQEQVARFKDYIHALRDATPYQYVLGYADFLSLRFEVNPSTLIPRPETEELVQWICSNVPRKNAKLTVLDIGTGSGCIAISLAKHFSEGKVYGIDLSEEAIGCAVRNAQVHEVEVLFERADMHQFYPKVKFDIIVSNPPYVRELEKKYMHKNVLMHEPPTALFVPDHDPLIHYRAVRDIAYSALKPDGEVYMEVNEAFAEEVAALFHQFSQVEVRSDLFGKPRMVKAKN